jgi:acetyl esterase/lipase
MQPFCFRSPRALVALVLAAQWLWVGAVHAGTLIKVPTRPGVETTLFWEPVAGARGTVLLFPGGAGGFGRVEDGRATSANFLVRSAPLFAAQGYNVAIFGRPNDAEGISPADRIGDAHLADIRGVLEHLKTLGAAPASVWLIGTSRGTGSATSAAIRLADPALAGVVLTASIVSYSQPDAVPKQNLAAIGLPVLVVHHTRDACRVTQPHEATNILKGLVNAPVKKLMLLDAGANPSGDVCGPLHWHGFIGMEPAAVEAMVGWIRRPVP